MNHAIIAKWISEIRVQVDLAVFVVRQRKTKSSQTF